MPRRSFTRTAAHDRCVEQRDCDDEERERNGVDIERRSVGRGDLVEHRENADGSENGQGPGYERKARVPVLRGGSTRNDSEYGREPDEKNPEKFRYDVHADYLTPAGISLSLAKGLQGMLVSSTENACSVGTVLGSPRLRPHPEKAFQPLQQRSET